MEIIGAVFVIVFGTLGHFIFEWSGHKKWAGLVFAVNESTWEHIKLAIYPTVIWGVIEIAVRGWSPVIPVATAAGLISMMILIPAIFYGYTALVGRNFLIADISVFLVSVIAGMVIYHKVLSCPNVSNIVTILSIIIIAAIIVMHLTLSYHPCHCFLFKDPVSGGYGPYGHDCNADFHHTHHRHNHE